MLGNNIVCGYLDVKILSKRDRGLKPWKAWQRRWCELKRLVGIHYGVEVTLKSCAEGSVLDCFKLPRSSVVCRTESHTKRYAFGVFTVGRPQPKPILFMAGQSESDSQEWMSAVRTRLCVADYLPVGESNFHVSLVDSAHSRATGLMGLHGILGTNTQGISISDPCTGQLVVSWQWQQFHQFHMLASPHPIDEKLIVVMHTSAAFPGGSGRINIYCKQAPNLLGRLLVRGKPFHHNNPCHFNANTTTTTSTNTSPYLVTEEGFFLRPSSKRLSRSEGDLCDTYQYNGATNTYPLNSTNTGTNGTRNDTRANSCSTTCSCSSQHIMTALNNKACCYGNSIGGDGGGGSSSPLCMARRQSESDDSGVRVSCSSDDENLCSGYSLKNDKTSSSLVSIGMGVLTKTPGGSENNDSVMDLTRIEELMPKKAQTLPRRESRTSLASGIYEEIPDVHHSPSARHLSPHSKNNGGSFPPDYAFHIYENPLDIILSSAFPRRSPPALPPRQGPCSGHFQKNNTHPAQISNGKKHSSSTARLSYHKQRCNTLPAKDLAKIGRTFTDFAEDEYVVMSPLKVPPPPTDVARKVGTPENTTKESISPRSASCNSTGEGFYMPMSEGFARSGEMKTTESCYMDMNGKKM